MPTLTTTEQVLYSGPAATVTVDNTGSGVAWVRWEGGLEMVAGPDAPLRIQSQGRTIYGSTKSGTTDVTVGPRRRSSAQHRVTPLSTEALPDGLPRWHRCDAHIHRWLGSDGPDAVCGTHGRRDDHDHLGCHARTQSELGLAPSGPDATVRARLDRIESEVAGKADGSVAVTDAELAAALAGKAAVCTPTQRPTSLISRRRRVPPSLRRWLPLTLDGGTA